MVLQFEYETLRRSSKDIKPVSVGIEEIFSLAQDFVLQPLLLLQQDLSFMTTDIHTDITILWQIQPAHVGIHRYQGPGLDLTVSLSITSLLFLLNKPIGTMGEASCLLPMPAGRMKHSLCVLYQLAEQDTFSLPVSCMYKQGWTCSFSCFVYVQAGRECVHPASRCLQGNLPIGLGLGRKV